ncbi:MAG: hypothetical protein VW548_04645 [Methylotenera sp.]
MATKYKAKEANEIEFEDDPALPPGWQKMVKDFKKRAQKDGGGSHILYLEEIFGCLECRCQLSAYADQNFMIDMHNFHRKSQRTCFECGGENASRFIINGGVEVYCNDCRIKAEKMDKENNITHTWLDSY